MVLLLLACNSIYSQKDSSLTSTKKIEYSKSRDKQIEKALQRWAEDDNSNDIRYHYNKVDLNGDGKLDAIVFASGNFVCGSGGCVMLIFKNINEEFKLITEMSVSRPPLIVLSTLTKGWKDLAMFISGGGAKPFWAVLKFNGHSYPENPTVAPAISKNRKFEGIEYLSGIKRYDTGFELK